MDSMGQASPSDRAEWPDVQKDSFDRERYEHVRSVAADILASFSDMDTALIHNLLRGEQGYATPKVDVRGAVFHDNRVLLVREHSDGLWTLPGG